jgi:hypothetical protein
MSKCCLGYWIKNIIFGFPKSDRIYMTRIRLSLAVFFLMWTLLSTFDVDGQLRGFNIQDSSGIITPDSVIIRGNMKSAENSSKETGNGYVNSLWKTADIMMNSSNKVITGVQVRLDAQHNLLEIKYDGKIKTLSSGNVKSIVIASEQTTYITDALLNKEVPKGFYRLVYNHRSSLLCHYYSEIRQSSYNRAIDMGDRKSAVVLMKEYYFLYQGKMLKLEGNRKKLARQFTSNEKIYDYIIREKLHPKNEFDLVKLVTFCDSINGTT